jgi:hypothetical protein
MAAKHGTRRRYNEGCHCDECKAANTAYRRDLRERHATGGLARPASLVPLSQPLTPTPSEPGPVESAVAAEIAELPQRQERPGLAQIALALARIMDNPRAVSSQPAAARQLVAILGTLSRRSHRRGKLALVKSMTEDA